MARKGNIEVDIKKENPLITIINAGKIPVVRLGKTGFQNFKQDKYFDNRADGAYKDKRISGRGCFVSILGVQGNYVCGGHYGEAIHIGYLEPDEKVFSTYYFDKKKNGFCYTTADERFKAAKLEYDTYTKKVEDDSYDLDDFDIYSEAIVDATKIKKAMVIKPNEYHLLFPYVNDGAFRIFTAETLLYNIIWEGSIQDEVLNHFHWKMENEHHMFYKDKEISELVECPFYKTTILKELFSYYTSGKFSKDANFYERMTDAIITYIEEMRPYYPSNIYGVNSMIYGVTENSVNFHYEKDEWRKCYSLSANSEKDDVSLAVHKNKYGSSPESEYYHFNQTNILSQEYRWILYNLVDMKNIFEKILGEFIHLEWPNWMKKLEVFKKFEDEITTWGHIVYRYDEKYSELSFSWDTSKFVYNMILKDGVLEINEDEGTKYYNTDNLPEGFSSTWLDIVMETLKLLRVS